MLIIFFAFGLCAFFMISSCGLFEDDHGPSGPSCNVTEICSDRERCPDYFPDPNNCEDYVKEHAKEWCEEDEYLSCLCDCVGLSCSKPELGEGSAPFYKCYKICEIDHCHSSDPIPF